MSDQDMPMEDSLDDNGPSDAEIEDQEIDAQIEFQEMSERGEI